jgi:hypothetical protein
LESQQKLLSRWFAKRVTDETETFCKLTNADIGPEEYLKRNLLFVTMTCRPTFGQLNGQDSRGYGPAAVRGAFQGWYCKVCQSIIGNSWQRKMPIQPLTFLALDADGSRVINIDWTISTNVHVHALMLFHPQAPAPSDLHELEDLRICDRRIDVVELDRFDPAKGSLLDLASYCTKGIRGGDVEGISFDMLPIRLEGRDTAIEANAQRYSCQTAE